MIYIIIDDNYTLKRFSIASYFKYKEIEIYLKQENYYISLGEGYFFEDDFKEKKLSYTCYEIKCDGNFYGLKLYVYKSFDGIDDYKIYKNVDLIISNHKNSNIITNDPYLSKYYLCISNHKINTNFEISLNNTRYVNDDLQDGDIIEFLGIRIIYNRYFLYINSFLNEVKIEEYKQIEKVIKFQNTIPEINYSLNKKIDELTIDLPKEYIPYQIKDNSDLYKTILPNLIMVISVSLMSLNSFVNSNNSNLSRIATIASPVAMVITSIILPIIFVSIQKKKDKKNALSIKNDYLNYLDNYFEEINIIINSYIKQIEYHYYSLLDTHENVFYVSKTDDYFLTLSLGKYTYSLNMDIPFCDDEDINKKLSSIRKQINNIDNYPLLIDLKKYRTISIYTKKSKKIYYLNKFILELAYKYNFNDVNIGIYSKDIRIIDDFYNLPHLFLSGERLTLSSYKKLQLLNQKKLTNYLIFFILDSCDFVFTNDKIIVIYITSKSNDIYPSSDLLIEYSNNNYLYLDKKISFIFYEEIIDAKKEYERLSHYLKINSNVVHSFKDVFNIEELERYYLIPQVGLEANFAYCNDELLSFDLHESKQGPHGLIGGSTGSGKSELIISMLLSLCVKYSPDYLNVVLIDYKGGGIKESLSYLNECIPHIVASLSNLESNSLDRLIIAIKNECKTRQLLFKELSNKSNLSIMNIDDYLKQDLLRYSMPKIANLLIVVDEFAELKKTNPEQIKELISISRIGRSLGVHLILATQKPNGVIDDEIFSNSRFKIALKVFEEKDSNDLIKTKDAAYLNSPGDFLLSVDNNLLKAKSIYSKNDIYSNDPYEVEILDESLNKIDSNSVSLVSTLSLCSYYSKRIIEVSKDLDKKIKPLKFMPNSPVCRETNRLIIGESDDYINSKYELLEYSYTDSILIFSTRKNEINLFLNYLNEEKRKTILIAANRYEKEYISDSLLYSEEEDIMYIFNYLLNNRYSNISLVIEDVFILLSYNDVYVEYLCKLIQRVNDKFSIYFITSNSSINFKIINGFNNKLVINADKSDISNIFSIRTDYLGTSFFYKDELIPFVPCLVEDFVSSEKIVEEINTQIPDIVKAEIIDNSCLLGFNIKDKQKVYFSDELLITSYNIELIEKYKNAYNDYFDISLYENSLSNSYHPSILWLGGGLFNQRLFIINQKNDLSNNEGLLIIGNKKIVLRIINE